MSKYLRSQHIPFNLVESKALQEGIKEFDIEIHDAGQLLRHCRAIKGWSLSELGDQAGVPADLILLMENGEQPIPLTEARRFGQMFDVDYHLFL